MVVKFRPVVSCEQDKDCNAKDDQANSKSAKPSVDGCRLPSRCGRVPRVARLAPGALATEFGDALPGPDFLMPISSGQSHEGELAFHVWAGIIVNACLKVVQRFEFLWLFVVSLTTISTPPMTNARFG